MKKEEKGTFKDFTDGHAKEERTYKNKVIFLRKSIKGDHLYAFDNNGAFRDASEGSIIMNISDVEMLLAGNYNFIKVSIIPKKEEEEEEEIDTTGV